MATPGQFVANAMLGGYQQGVAQREGKKEQLRQLDLQSQLNEDETNVGSLQQKYSLQLGPNGEETPESLKTKYALSRVLQQKNSLLDPQQKPSAVGNLSRRIGEALHLEKKPDVPSMTVQPAAVSAPATGATLAATPEYSARSVSAPAAAAAPAPGAAQPAAGVDTSNLVPVARGMNRVFPARAGYHLVSNPAERQRIYYQSDTNPADIIPATARGVGNRPAGAVATMPAAQPGFQQYSAPNSAVVTQSFQGRTVPGMVSQGNIDITNRADIVNPDGTHSSLNSMSSEVNGKEVLYPGVGDGTTYPRRRLTQQEAFDQYRRTGKNLGTFDNPKAADAYAQQLHLDQVKYGNNPGLQDQANQKWGFLKGQNVNFVRKLNSPLPYQSETWAAGNAASRPKEYPLNQNFVEQYKPGFTSDDYAAEVFSHIDPKGIEYSKRLLASMDAGQIEALKQAAGDYKETIANGQPENEALRNASEAVLRGWIFGQGWSPKDFNDFEFDSKQKALLEEAKNYALTGNGSPSGSSTMRQEVPSGQAQAPTQPAAGGQPRITTTTEPGVAETTLPPMGAAAPPIQFGRPTTVHGPTQTLAQLRAQAQANQRVQRETEALTAAAPLTLQQQTVQQAQANTAGMLETIRGGLDAIKTFHPNATPDDLTKLNNAYLDTVLGTVDKRLTYKPLTGTKPYKGADGRFYQSMQNSLTGEIAAQPMPEGYTPPPERPLSPGAQYMRALVKRTEGQSLSPEESAALTSYPEYVRQTSVIPGMARAAAFGAARPMVVVNPENPEQTMVVSAGQAERGHYATPASMTYQLNLAGHKAMIPRGLGTNMAALATAEDHLRMADGLVDALGTGNIVMLNRLSLAWAQATGDTAPTDFETVKTSLEGEMARAFTGVGATQGEIASIGSIVDKANSPQALKSALNYARQTMEARRRNLWATAQQAGITPTGGGGTTPPAPTRPARGGGNTLVDRLNNALGGR